MVKPSTAIILVLLISACSRDGSSDNVVVIPKGENAGTASQVALPPGLAETKKICLQCHAMPNPSQHHPAAWPSILARMEGHMRANGKMMPNLAEREAILTYLQSGWQK